MTLYNAAAILINTKRKLRVSCVIGWQETLLPTQSHMLRHFPLGFCESNSFLLFSSLIMYGDDCFAL